MNTGMQSDNSNDEDIIMCQNRIKNILLNLRDKRRKSRYPEDDDIDHLSNKWNRYNRPHILQPVQESSKNYDVYPLHKALELREKNEETEEMLKHLSQLQRLAHEYVDIIFFCIYLEFYVFPLFFIVGKHAKWEMWQPFVNYVKRKHLAY